jgi:hypothetical protein
MCHPLRAPWVPMLDEVVGDIDELPGRDDAGGFDRLRRFVLGRPHRQKRLSVRDMTARRSASESLDHLSSLTGKSMVTPGVGDVVVWWLPCAPMSPRSESITTHQVPVPVAGVSLRVAPSPKHGLGVYATCDIAANEVVHVAPVMLISDEDVETLEATPLRGLVYGWEDGHPTAAFALGVGSLFNHDGEPNCVYHRVDAGDVDEATGAVHEFDGLQYSTLREIRAGEELFIDYSGGDPSLLWFDPI